ncbi:MAG: hypothetical protein KBT00_04920 [Bacteroidales bacterium]|nr:hypothetical protein [Candidatus Cacconaster merdequi]
MKRIILSVVLAFALTSAFAQQEPDDIRKGDRMPDRIHSEKIAWFTQDIDLTPEEAVAFWPLYNQFSKENRAAHLETVKAFKEMEKCTKNEASTKDECLSAINAYLDASAAEYSLIQKYYPLFLKVLPAEKVGRMYVSEENFRRKMLKDIQNRHFEKAPSKRGKPSGNRKDNRDSE